MAHRFARVVVLAMENVSGVFSFNDVCKFLDWYARRHSWYEILGLSYHSTGNRLEVIGAVVGLYFFRDVLDRQFKEFRVCVVPKNVPEQHLVTAAS